MKQVYPMMVFYVRLSSTVRKNQWTSQSFNLQSILEDFQKNSNKQQVNKNCEVLVENKLNLQEKYFGRTKYMTPVKFESSSCSPGEIVNVKITSCNQNGLFGLHGLTKNKAA